MAGFSRTVVAVGGVVVAIVSGCGATTDQRASGSSSAAPTSAPASAATDTEVAAAAEAVIRQNFALKPDEPFAMYQCRSEGEMCWLQYITGFAYDAGVLRVTVQVDRSSAMGMKIGERAALSVRNFLQADRNPLLKQVKLVMSVDGTGAEIDEYAM